MANLTINHPLYETDREIVDGLLTQSTPDTLALSHAGRLFIRYDGFPGAYDIKEDLAKCLSNWGMDLDQMNASCIKLWGEGFRPGDASNELSVGSGAS